MLSESYNAAGFSDSAFLKEDNEKDFVVEVGPRLNFSTAWSTNAISIFHACGLDNIPRAECSRRYKLHCSEPLSDDEKIAFTNSIHDRMTEQPYTTRLTSFKTGVEAAPIKTYPVVANGREELRKVRRFVSLTHSLMLSLVFPLMNKILIIILICSVRC